MVCLRLRAGLAGRGAVAGAEKPERSRRRTLSTGRLEAFSDGVLAIAITLLVLDITVRPPGGLAEVLREWPAYLAYVVSFLTIGAVWLAHSTLTEVLARTDSILSRLNLLLLLAVSFLPFPTRLVADSLSLAPTGPERVAVSLYGLVLLTVRVLLATVVLSRYDRTSAGRQIIRSGAPGGGMPRNAPSAGGPVEAVEPDQGHEISVVF
jgi:uncharacterized membrane protein